MLDAHRSERRASWYVCGMLHKYVSHHIIANSSVWYCLIPCHFLPYRQSYPPPPWECDRSHSLLCCIAFARSTGKLRKTCVDTVGHLTEFVPSITVSEKWPPAQRFDVQAADWRSPIQVLTQRKAAWLGWPPGTGHLSHTEHCRCVYVCVCVEFSDAINLWKPKTRQQIQNSETNPKLVKKNRGVSVEHRGVCVCGMFGCDQSMKFQTQ